MQYTSHTYCTCWYSPETNPIISLRSLLAQSNEHIMTQPNLRKRIHLLFKQKAPPSTEMPHSEKRSSCVDLPSSRDHITTQHRTYSTSNEMPESSTLVENIPVDVQLAIISFLDIPSTSALMACNRKLRNLLTSDSGKCIWTSHFNRLVGLKHSQALEVPALCLQDDLAIPTAASATISAPYRIHNSINMPFLLSRVPENLPSAMITKVVRLYEDNLFSRLMDHFGLVMEHLCVSRANNPLPRPVRILPKTDTKYGKIKRLFARKRPKWSPFVVPYTTSGDAVNVTPRLVSYFEATIGRKTPCKGRQQEEACEDGSVSIGIAEESPKGYGLPGWDGHSYGYHGDGGGINHCSGYLLRLTSSYGPGDVVGMGIDYAARGIFVTKNGTFLGFASYKLTVEYLSNSNFYPVVGIMNSNDISVSVNFGDIQQKFRFDLAAYCNRQQQLLPKRERIATRYQFSTKTGSR